MGLGFRPAFQAELFLQRGRVDFLEITADHYFEPPPEKLDELELLAAHFPLIPDLSLGSAEGIDPTDLERFAALIEGSRRRGGASTCRSLERAACPSDISEAS